MRIAKFLTAAALLAGAAWAADYLVDGGDPGRTGWIKAEKIFNTTNVRGMKLLWKINLPSQPREMHNLFPPLVVENVATSSGNKEVAIVAGISDDLWGIDTATGQQLWHKHFDSTWVPPPPGQGRGGQTGTLCPGGQLATPAIGPGAAPGKYTAYAVSWDGRLRQINVADGEDLVQPENFMPPNTKPWSLGLKDGTLWTAISQGCGGRPFSFFTYDLRNRKTSAFLPMGGGLWGRRGVAIDARGIGYMGTGDGPYAPENKNLGNAIVSVKPDSASQLQLSGYFAPPNVKWLWRRDLDINVSPVVIDHKGRHLMFGTSKECRIWLVDRDVMNTTALGPEHMQMLDQTPLICNDSARFDAAGPWGAMAVWEDKAGQLFVALPFLGPLSNGFKAPVEIGKPQLGGVATFRVDLNAGKWHLTPLWTYGDIDQADEAIYANGILFVNAAGEDTYQQQPDRAWEEQPYKMVEGRGSGTRIANSRRAAIYALDAATGKLLWSSGSTITSWNHGSGMTAVNGKAYIGTFDGALYCFGVTK